MCPSTPAATKAVPPSQSSGQSYRSVKDNATERRPRRSSSSSSATFWRGLPGFLRLYYGTWIPRLARQGLGGVPVEEEDYPPMHEMFDAEELLRRADVVLGRFEATGRSPSIIAVIFRVGWRHIVAALVCGFCQGLSSTVLRPVVLARAIRLAGAGAGVAWHVRFGTAALFGGAVLVEGLAMALSMLNVQLFSLQAFEVASTLVARRAAAGGEGVNLEAAFGSPSSSVDKSAPTKEDEANNNNSKKKKKKVSEVNLVGNDLIQCVEMSRFIVMLPSSVLAIAGGVYYLATAIGGVATTSGVATMCTVLFVNTQLASVAKAAQKTNLGHADERMELVGEALRGIRSLKLFGWEQGFLDRVGVVRARECVSIFRFRCSQVVALGIGRSSPSVAACVAFVTAKLIGRPMDAITMFAAVSVFQALRVAMIMLPQTYMYVLVIHVSLKRLDDYLYGGKATWRLDEPNEDGLLAHLPRGTRLAFYGTNNNNSSSNNNNNNNNNNSSSNNNNNNNIGLSIDASTTTRKAALDSGDHDLRVQAGDLVAVVGAVGAGKSSLIAALLNKLEVLSDGGSSSSLKRCVAVAVAPQKSFVVSATVRDNIVLGRAYDAEKYDRVVDQAQLAADFAQFVSGDLCEVGERGVTLSGGQQARVTLARALYAAPDLLLADDPLSALDVRVARRVFDSALRAYPSKVRGTACVIALNQMHLARLCDVVLVLEEGRIVDMGRPADLLAPNKTPGPFARLVQEQKSSGETAAPHDNAVSIDDTLMMPPGNKGTTKNPSTTTEEAATSMLFEGSPDENNEVDEAAPLVAADAAAVVVVSVVGKDEKKDETARLEEGKLVRAEGRSTKAISMTIYADYVRSFGTVRFLVAILVCACAYACFAMEGLALQRWVNVLDVEDRGRRRRRERSARSDRLMGRYVAFVCLGALGIVTTSVLFSVGGVRASRSLHAECLGRVMRAPLSYFDATPTGRLTSRFSADLTIVDLQISTYVDHVAQMAFQVFVFAVVVSAVAPPMAVLLGLALGLYVIVVQMADAALRNAKRLANVAFAPLMTNVSELIASRAIVEEGGDASVAAYFLERHAKNAERVAHLRYCTEAVPTWANVTVSAFAATCAFGTCATVLFDARGVIVSRDTAALALTYSVLLPYFFSVLMWQLTTLRLYFASLERLLELRAVPEEAAAHTVADPPVAAWPSHGAVHFDRVTLKYRPELPPAIRDLDLRVRGGEHVGIIGRTGAGKSTLASMLLRLVEPSGGAVFIDGVDLAKVGLATLRRRVSMIPQEAVLLSGSVGRNVDPFEEHDAAAKLSALRRAGLATLALDHPVGADGGSISAGERQLLGVARALLRSSRVVLMDEPSSNVDEATDAALQRALRAAFEATTTLVIAHRLETIIEAHTIVTLDAGTLAEAGPPADLVNDPKSRLHTMLNALPPNQAANLRRRALNAPPYATASSS